MAGDFLGRLFGRAKPSPEVAGALAELSRLRVERSALAGSADLLADLLPILFDEPVSAPAVSTERAAAKLDGGLSLLRGETLALDAAFRRRWLRIVALLTQHRVETADLATAMHRGALVPEELLHHVLAGRPEAVAERAAALNLDAGLLATALRLTALPTLLAMQTQLRPAWVGVRWEQGCCPVCGSRPLLGEFRGLDQTRFLRCGWCAAEWATPRLFCPFCGNRDHRTLELRHREGEEPRLRAAVCTACGGHVKMLSTLTPLSAPQLLVADLASLHLDLALLS